MSRDLKKIPWTKVAQGQTKAAQRDRVKASFARHGDESAVARELDMLPAEVRLEVAKFGKPFRTELVKATLLQTIMLGLNRLIELIPRCNDPDVVRKAVNNLIERLQALDSGPAQGRPPKTQAGAIQNIFNLKGEEAERLKESLDAIEGELIDDSDTTA